MTEQEQPKTGVIDLKFTYIIHSGDEEEEVQIKVSAEVIQGRENLTLQALRDAGSEETINRLVEKSKPEDAE